MSRAVNEWMAPQISATRGEPDGGDPAAVADVLARHYERWGASTDRMLRQEDVSPALTEAAAAGRVAHASGSRACSRRSSPRSARLPAPTASPA